MVVNATSTNASDVNITLETGNNTTIPSTENETVTEETSETSDEKGKESTEPVKPTFNPEEL